MVSRLGHLQRSAPPRQTEDRERQVLQIASELWPDNGSDRQIRNAQERREAVLRLFTDSATVGNAPGTRWCAANALLEQLE
jgi:hypothetical protein